MTQIRKYRLLCPIARALDLVGDRAHKGKPD